MLRFSIDSIDLIDLNDLKTYQIVDKNTFQIVSKKLTLNDSFFKILF